MKNKKKNLPFTDKQPQNKPKSIKTKDGKQFKIVDTLLMKYSMLLKSLIEDERNQEDVIEIREVDSECFEVISQFMHLHKDKQPARIQLPLKSNQSLKYVIEQGDALLIEKIMARGDQFLSRMLEASSYLQIEDLKKRLIAGLAIRLLRNTVGQLKQMYNITEYDVKDEQVREEAHKRVKQLLELKEEL